MSKDFSLSWGTRGSRKDQCFRGSATILEEKGVEVLTTREPGGVLIGEKIREVILDPSHTQMDAKTELLLYIASRRQHLVEKFFQHLKLASWSLWTASSIVLLPIRDLVVAWILTPLTGSISLRQTALNPIWHSILTCLTHFFFTTSILSKK